MTEQLTAAPDTLLAGRYRLQRPVSVRATTTTWRGLDQVLARPVAVKILDHAERLAGGTAAFLDAAVAAGRLTHPRIASVLDAAEEGGLTYVVAEWVEGDALVDLLRDGPLPAPRATTIAAQVAETVAYAHSRGVFHLGLSAHDVLVCSDGAIKVTDFELAAASRPKDAPPLPDADLPKELRDTRAVAALLYACLTGRSVDGVDPELPLAPQRDGRLCAPRQVRAGVPREVDLVVVRTLLPDLARKAEPIRTPADLVTALAPLPGEGGGSVARPLLPDDPPVPRPPRRLLRYGLPAVLVAGAGVVSLLAGLAIGRVPGQVTKLPGLGTGASAQPQESAAPGTPIAPKAVRDFDPQGDAEENSNEVALAYNGDPTDAWHTTTYYNNPAFGGLKSGVGLLVDFGRPTAFDRVVVAFAQPGESVELRATDAVPGDANNLPVVASAADVKVPVTLRPQRGTTARYWLVWITKLVRQSDGKFSAGVAELGFFR
ncbi:MAG TPA: protein kinase family protein [Mycobacteriales bacterium]|nr:protein kinase family protein [Mycobacteriales bacterium]